MKKEVLIFAKNSQLWCFLGDSKPNNTPYIKNLHLFAVWQAM
jgi:hypothetical protein